MFTEFFLLPGIVISQTDHTVHTILLEFLIGGSQIVHGVMPLGNQDAVSAGSRLRFNMTEDVVKPRRRTGINQNSDHPAFSAAQGAGNDIRAVSHFPRDLFDHGTLPFGNTRAGRLVHHSGYRHDRDSGAICYLFQCCRHSIDLLLNYRYFIL